MKINLLIIAFSVAVAFASCSESNSKKEDSAKTSLKEELGLTLDGDKKWPVNEATHLGMHAMDSMVRAFTFTDSFGYNDLGEMLNGQTNYIIQNCDMTGEAHNQLHHVLHPILDKIAALVANKDKIKGQADANELQKLLSLYFEFFEYH